MSENGKKKKAAEALPPKKLKEIWSKIRPADWHALLGEHKPNNQWKLSGNTIKGCCPFHDEKTPSFVINTERRTAHCFGSCNKSFWNPLKFYADISGMGYAAAVKDLQRRFNLRLPAAYSRNVQKLEDNETLKRALMRAMHDEFVALLENPDAEEFEYAKKVHKSGLVDWLRLRKIPEDVAHLWPVGVLPPRARLMQRLDTIGGDKILKPAEAYMGDYISGCEGALVFFCFTTPTTLGRFKIRIPKDGREDKKYVIDDPYCDDVGFFGLNMYPHLMGHLGKYPLIVVEGEFDALSIIGNQLVHTEHGEVYIIASGGKMEASDGALDDLMEFGFEETRLVPDNDKGGIGWAKQLLKGNQCVDRVFRWPVRLEHLNDIDQAVREARFPEVMNFLQDVENFPRNHTWAAERLDVDLQEVDKDDIETKYDKAAEYGSVLKASEQIEYAKNIADNHGFDKSLVIQDMTISGDTPEAFTARIAEKLKDEYFFLSQNQVGRGVSITAWSRRKRVMRSIPTDSPATLRGVLQTDLGSLDGYIHDNLGEPDFLKFKMTPKGPVPVDFLVRTKMVSQYFQSAIDCLEESAMPRESLKELGQGFHYFPSAEEDGVGTIYVVNGTNFFKGTVTQKDGVQYEQLESPASDGYLFSLASQPWSRNLTTLDDIEKSQYIDPEELYDNVFKMLVSGWKFKNGELDATFLAADILYTAVAPLFNHMTMIALNGLSHSGKTTLMQFIGGNKYPGYRLCEPAIFMDDFTAAGIRQMMTGMSLRLLLDEFEDKDDGSGRIDRKTSAVREMLNMIRSLAHGADSVRGTATGEHMGFHIKFPLTVGGIQTMREYRDVNRFVHIDMQHIAGINDPISAIQKRFTKKEMSDIRRGLTLCWLTRADGLLAAYEEVQLEFEDNSLLPAGVFTRLKVNYLPVAAVLKYIGKDYRSFMRDFSAAKVAELAEQGSSQECTTLWNEIMNSLIPKKNFDIEHSGGFVSVAKLLSDNNTSHLLNNADLGAYYISKRKWLVVYWNRIIPGVLCRSNLYRNAQFPARLKKTADADPRCISKEQISRGSFLKDEVFPLLGAKVTVDDISVIDIRETLSMHDSVSEPAAVDASKRAEMLDDIPEDITRGNFE